MERFWSFNYSLAYYFATDTSFTRCPIHKKVINNKWTKKTNLEFAWFDNENGNKKIFKSPIFDYLRFSRVSQCVCGRWRTSWVSVEHVSNMVCWCLSNQCPRLFRTVIWRCGIWVIFRLTKTINKIFDGQWNAGIFAIISNMIGNSVVDKI